MQYQVKLAGLRDFGALMKLQKQIANEAKHLAITGKDRRDSLLYAFAKTLVHRKRVHTFIALDEGKVVGYITAISGKFLKVRGTSYVVMGVLASYRGRGIGTELLKRAEELARGHGMHRMELEVFEKNEDAVRLYEKLGFVTEGRRREAIKTPDGYDDIIWMGKLLDERVASPLRVKDGKVTERIAA
ncbi:MAG: GNAT family N-acetyltransferase [bacterium]|nr:GNAT family N-acetyltransferase [bacterium]